MPPELAAYITQYGYLAIFSLVFIQELGVPNPVPTELILLYAGYLTSIGILDVKLAFLTAISGDLIGTTVLCTIFYVFGHKLIERQPKWLPLKKEKVEKLKDAIDAKGKWGIFVWRLIPYVRGYASVASGLLGIPLRIFIPMAGMSAIIASGGYIIVGHFFGNRWEDFVKYIGGPTNIILSVLCALALIFLGRRLYKQIKLSREKHLHHEELI